MNAQIRPASCERANARGSVPVNVDHAAYVEAKSSIALMRALNLRVAPAE
jgi:hypothetical protein